MWLPVCSVALINGDCPTGWAMHYIAQATISSTDLKQLVVSGIIPLCTAYAFRVVRQTIHD